jgi:hypothetical protein
LKKDACVCTHPTKCDWGRPTTTIHVAQELAVDAATVVPALCSNTSLPCLRALALRLSFSRGGGPALVRVLSAPWLAQLTRLDLDADHRLVAKALPRGGLDLPQLRELWLRGACGWTGGLKSRHAAALAACRLPRLETLGLFYTKPGSIAALMAAPWAAGLSRVELRGTGDVDWFDASAVAPLARASSLTWLTLMFFPSDSGHDSLEAAYQTGMDGPKMAELLAAPWSTSLQRLEFNRQQLGENPMGDAARAALAAVALPALRALHLVHTGPGPAGWWTFLRWAAVGTGRPRPATWRPLLRAWRCRACVRCPSTTAAASARASCCGSAGVPPGSRSSRA